jgi:hypothetical protein
MSSPQTLHRVIHVRPGQGALSSIGVGGNQRAPRPVPAVGKPAIGQAVPVIGRQLQSRVASGVITKEQAMRTARQRALFHKAFGPDWRDHVFDDTAIGKLRRQNASNPTAKSRALYQQMLKRRQRMLEVARSRVG